MNPPFTLLILCLIGGASWVSLVSLLFTKLYAKAPFDTGLPEMYRERVTFSLFLMQNGMDSLLYVAIPTLGYSFFALILPLAGVRPAFVAAMAILTAGILPALMGMSARVKLGLPFLLLYTLECFLKVSGALTLIGWLHSL